MNSFAPYLRDGNQILYHKFSFGKLWAWKRGGEEKTFSFFMFLINFFHSVSFFTSHLIKHIFFHTLSLSLSFFSFYLSSSSIWVFLSTFVYRFYDFKKYIFIDFSFSRMCLGDFFSDLCFPLKFYPYCFIVAYMLLHLSHNTHLITSISHRCSILFHSFSSRLFSFDGFQIFSISC